MRTYVDLRTNGKNAYATPSEYVRDLIRGDLISAGDVEARSKAFLEELSQEDRK